MDDLIDNVLLREEARKKASKQGGGRFVKTHAKKVDERRTKSTVKTCPFCEAVVSKRKEDKCPRCNRAIYLCNGEYFAVSAPVERLILYNLGKGGKLLENIDVIDISETQLRELPNLADLTIQQLKSESWAASKLLEVFQKDIRVCTYFIDLWYSVMTTGPTGLYYMVHSPYFKNLKDRAYAEFVRQLDRDIALLRILR